MKKMKDDKMLEYNLKLNGEYFFVNKGKEWELRRNKYFTHTIMNSKENTIEENTEADEAVEE